ncbi:MAG TPA: hypothetical protein PLD66_05255 [Accumulibacter sp.]|nr:hypothetical protein [Accumulibacter sp.]
MQEQPVKALRLADISHQTAANVFFPEYPASHNARFAGLSETAEDVHVAYRPSGLAQICAIYHRHTLSKNLLLSFKRQRHILQTDGSSHHARRENPGIVVYPGPRIELLHGEEILPCKVFDPARPEPPLAPRSYAAAFRGVLIGQILKANTRRTHTGHLYFAFTQSLQNDQLESIDHRHPEVFDTMNRSWLLTRNNRQSHSLAKARAMMRSTGAGRLFHL